VSDLFDRLATRTLGAGTTGTTPGASVAARPRLPSRFEGSGPAGAALVVEDVAASARGSLAASPVEPPAPVGGAGLRREPATETPVAEPATLRPTSGTDPADVRRSVEADKVGSRADRAAPPRPGRSGVVEARPPAATPIVLNATGGEGPARTDARHASPSEPGPSHQPGGEASPEALPRVAAAPLRVAAAPPSAASPVASEAARGQGGGSDGATIRVSIGRVEVRANLVAAPPPRPAPRARREDALALGDYLRGKRGGA
jgi:hypothetical protein